MYHTGEGFFIRICSNRIRGNNFKLEEGRFRLRKRFFTVRMVRHRNRLLSETVDVPTLEAFQARLDGDLTDLVKREVPLPIAERMELDDL